VVVVVMKAVVEAVSAITDGSAEQCSTKYWEPAFIVIVITWIASIVGWEPSTEVPTVVMSEAPAMSPMARVEPTAAMASMTAMGEATAVAARVAPAVATTHMATTHMAAAMAAAVPVLRQRCRRPAQHSP